MKTCYARLKKNIMLVKYQGTMVGCHGHIKISVVGFVV
jgi:hypothetical protein